MRQEVATQEAESTARGAVSGECWVGGILKGEALLGILCSCITKSEAQNQQQWEEGGRLIPVHI